MTKRYRIMIAAAGTALIVAVGGIAAAEQGGQSADHRKNPTTTTVAAESTTTTVTTAAAPVNPQSDETESEGVGSESNRTNALCWAMYRGSEQGQWMKQQHGQAFQNLSCDGAVAPNAGGDEGSDVGEAQGPPENSNAGGNGGAQGQDADNPNAHGGNPHKP